MREKVTFLNNYNLNRYWQKVAKKESGVKKASVVLATTNN